jgi:Flp pilus assembly protein TadB
MRTKHKQRSAALVALVAAVAAFAVWVWILLDDFQLLVLAQLGLMLLVFGMLRSRPKTSSSFFAA